MTVNIAGFTVVETIFDSIKTVVYRAKSEQAESVILKVLKDDQPTSAHVARYQREFNIIKQCHASGVQKGIVKACSLGSDNDRPVLVLEDCDGTALIQYTKNNPLPLKLFLTLAIQIADALEAIHSAGVIHKNITPANIIWNQDSGELQIIDFNIATLSTAEHLPFVSPNCLEGTLAYISPEQTGRMNRVVDYRSDLYSLGVTLYQMLIGHVPFKTKDSLELVHAHLAKEPEAPYELNDGIPMVISDIVMKLMAKAAESRYRSAAGLKADLERCLDTIKIANNGANIKSFPLATDDVSGQLEILPKLYGREKECQSLLNVYDKVLSGKRELFLVTGYSGTGKSTLVHEVHKSIGGKQGFFIEGKFDQYQRNIPYSAWIQALEYLISSLLIGEQSKLDEWASAIQTAVGVNGRVLTEVIPNLEVIIGEQPDVTSLGGQETQNRFNYTFQSFIKVVARREHPLVVFLDDLQWLDLASLDLIAALLTDTSIEALMVIGAYRDNEVSATHPLIAKRNTLYRKGVDITELQLTNLTETDIKALLVDSLALSQPDSQELSALVHRKTLGNAFFTHQLLHTLAENKLLTFNATERRWQWDVAKINAAAISDNVVELMLGKISKLPSKAQELLKLASCIGNQFHFSTLAIISGQSEEALYEILKTAFQHNYVSHLNGEARFTHDRIQQACYSLIHESEVKATHLKIGRLKMQNLSATELHDRIFSVISHFKKASDLIESDTEKLDVINLGIRAARRAFESNAYMQTEEYLSLARHLVSESWWDSAYELMLELHNLLARAAFYNANYVLMSEVIQTISNHARTEIDKLDAREIEILFHIADRQQGHAVIKGLEYLQALGIKLVTAVNSDIVIEEVEVLPDMTSPLHLGAMTILNQIITPAWSSNPQAFKRICLTMANLTWEHGVCESSAVCCAFYGGLLCGEGDITQGYRYGKVAMAMSDSRHFKKLKARIHVLFHATVMHWKKPLQETVWPFYKAYEQGVEAGDMEYACHGIVEPDNYQFLMGAKLDYLIEKYSRSMDALGRMHQDFHVHYLAPYYQAAMNLAGIETSTDALLEGQFFSITKSLPDYIREEQYTLLCVACQAQTIQAKIMGNHKLAFEYAELTEKYKAGGAGMNYLPVHNFFYSLVLIEEIRRNPSEKENLLEIVGRNQKELAQWVEHCPENCAHKHTLVAAELADLEQNYTVAQKLYGQSASDAFTQQYLHEEALAYELAATSYLRQGMHDLSKLHIQKAYSIYSQWGAQAKINALETDYPHWLKDYRSHLKTVTTTTNKSLLDFESFTKASHALFGAIEINELLSNIIKIVIENTGAEKGSLILKRDEGWDVVAEGTLTESVVFIDREIDIKDSNEVCAHIIYYVARTSSAVILDDACNAGMFAQDEYIRQNEVNSVLCAPLTYGGQFKAVIYLENNLTTHVFTEERVGISEILLSQAAVALENARLYKNLALSEARLKHALTSSNEGIWDWDIQADAFYFSDTYFTMLGYDSNELPHTMETWLALLHPEDKQRHLDSLEYSLSHKLSDYNIEYRIRKDDGDYVWVLCKGKIVERDADGRPSRMVGTHTDINYEKNARENLRQLASYDHLTQLPNRTLFIDTVDKAIARGQRKNCRHAILYMDLDRFKHVNDSLGHSAGDELLISVTERLSSMFRGEDIIARLGGDEFTVLLQEVTATHQASEAAARILEVLNKPVNIHGHEVVVGGSVGIVFYPDNATTSGELLKKADTAMYHAKREGGNSYSFFSEKMNIAAQKHMELEETLRSAIKQKEIILYYQPQVDAKTGDIVSMEALCRWQKKDGTLVSPLEFIPIAEETGLIIPIGDLIFEQAFHVVKFWTKNNIMSQRLAINISARQFKQKNLLENIISTLDKLKLSPEYIELEITEAALMESTEDSINIMKKIKETGITLAIDDFGTGYSSLSYLKKFPVDTLKIDISFIKDMEHSDTDRNIVKTIIELAHNLKLKVVAEGVETEKQANILTSMGCDILQGYLFSRPVTADAMEQLLRDKIFPIPFK